MSGTGPVVVVGGGIVGLSCAFHLVERGRAVTLVERSDGAGPPGASFGNAGGIAVAECVPAAVPGLWRKVPGWMLDPLGPLHVRPGQLPRMLPWLAAFLRAGEIGRVRRIARALAGLNGRVYADLVPLLERIGLAGQLHRAGALVLYRDARARSADALEWEIKRDNGVRFDEVGRDEIAELDPAVAPSMSCGILLPDWAHVSDPAAIVRGMQAHLRARGVAVLEGEAVRILRREGRASGVALRDGREIEGDATVLAAGAWSARLAPDRVLLESERGYNMTLPEPGVQLRRQLIFGAEKFVATPLSVGLRIGGAAEFAGLGAPPNFQRSEALVRLAARMLPGLDAEGGAPWMGERPATPDSLPVLGESPSTPGLFYAFGHGHLGLTQAAPTGRIIADLVGGGDPGIDLQPFSAARFAAGGQPTG